MLKRPSVIAINKKYNTNFFLDDLFGEKCPCIEDFPKAREVIEKLRKDGYTCVKHGDYWHVFNFDPQYIC